MVNKRRKKTSGSEARLQALSEILAIEARRDPEVQRFRKEVLGGRVLSLEEAKRWIHAQAQEGASRLGLLLPLELQKEKGKRYIPIGETGALFCLKQVAGRLAERVAYEINLPDGRTILRKTGLTGFWTEPEAVRFVLCDLPPRLSPVRCRITFTGLPETKRIRLDIDGDATPAEVLQAFRQARRITHFGESVARYRRTRPLSEKALKLAVFLAETPELRWQERMDRWNTMYPKWRYVKVVHFLRDSAKAYHRVRGLKWKQREYRKAALDQRE